MNHYEVLGVAPESGAGEIKKAYLAAARRYHPDFHADADAATRTGNARRMQELNQAWEVLGDATARAAYDRSLLAGNDPGVARRAAREQQVHRPGVPEGKGWTPRADDDGWMTDFDAWADERDELAPDVPRSGRRKAVTLLPIALFAAAVVCAFVGLAVQLNELIALAAVCIILAGGLFIMLPMYEMSRGRRR
ncbi:J domain-containing protein [Aquihabitans daechungensis]|uniref:J domain-containing protein n=1 Tax=Aquihabitans daechungensis TaxID=1052257 RepID=UPI003BA3D85F